MLHFESLQVYKVYTFTTETADNYQVALNQIPGFSDVGLDQFGVTIFLSLSFLDLILSQDKIILLDLI